MASIGFDNPFNPNSSFRERYIGTIESQLTSNSVSSNTQSNPVHAPSISSYNFSQIITAVRAAAKSYNRLSKRVNNLSSQFSSLPTSVRSMKRAIQNARDSTKRYASVTRTLGNTVISARKALQPLQGMQKFFQEAKKSTQRYTSLTRTLGNTIASARRNVRSSFSKKNLNASDIQKQVKNINTGRHVLNRVPLNIRTPSSTYGRQLSRDLSASVPAMTLAEFVSHRLHNAKSRATKQHKTLNSDDISHIRGKANVDYQRLHLKSPLRDLSGRMRSVLRPFQAAKKRGSMTQRVYVAAENNASRFFGNSGEYRQIAGIIADRIQKELPHLKNREHKLSQQLGLNGLNKKALNSNGTINGFSKSGRKSLVSLLKIANNKNNSKSGVAQAYLKNSSDLENLTSLIPSLKEELSALVSGINYMTSELSGTNGNYMTSDSNKSPLPSTSEYQESAQKTGSTGYNGRISTNPLSRLNPHNITLRPDIDTLKGSLFTIIRTAAHSAMPAYFAQLKSNDVAGNQLRMQMAPQIYSQVLGNSINGGSTPYDEDNTLERRMGGAAYRYGETPEQMTQNIQSLSGTRDTNNNDMTRAAINEGRFERANNVDPQVAQQLFGTLGQGGGLGSRGNQVNSNLSSLSAQFAGMLNRDHLGGMSNQQASGLNSIFGSMLNSGQSITPHTAGNVMAMQSVLSQGRGGQVFQGQQGAQQLNAFSQGVGGAFNNQLIRNAFAGGMPQYGGQQGLYKLQMDMQEPLKHPTQLNNMIQGMSNIAGPAGAEDALTQMGLGPSAAKQIYHKAMTGQLTEGNLKRVQQQNKRRGRTTQDRALRAYNKTGTSTVERLNAIRKNTELIVSQLGDIVRRRTNDIEGPISNTDHGGLIDSGLQLLGNVGPTAALSFGGSMILSHMLGGKGGLLRNIFRVARPKTWEALHKGFKEGNGLTDSLKHAGKAYKSAYNIGKSPSLYDKSRNVVHAFRSHISPVIRKHLPHVNGPLAGKVSRKAYGLSKQVPHLGKYVSGVGRAITKHPQALKWGKGISHFAGRALDYAAPATGAWTAWHYLRRGRPIRAISGGLDATLSNSDVGLGADVLGGGAKMLGMHGLGNFIEKAGNSPLHSLGKLLGFDKTSKAATRNRIGSSESHAQTRYSVYYWLRRINRLLPALAKKMSGFSDVDPSLAGNTSSYASSKMNNGDTNTNKQSTPKPGTSTTPNGPSSNSGAKSYNGTGNSGVNAQDTAATIQPAQISSGYFDATLGTTNNTDDHSQHEDSHNVYKNYINAPSQNFLSKLMENSQKAQAYFGHTHRTEWA